MPKKGGGRHSHYDGPKNKEVIENNNGALVNQANMEARIIRERLGNTIVPKNIPNRVRTMGEKFLDLLKSVKGSTMPYTLLSDLVALSLSEWDDSSAENPEITLEQIKNNYYPDWKPEDFKMLLGLIGEKDGDFKKMIEKFEKERAE